MTTYTCEKCGVKGIQESETEVTHGPDQSINVTPENELGEAKRMSIPQPIRIHKICGGRVGAE
ncbi:hypothetical protein HKL94_00165 [Candidatus Parcubacteria bacterium]|nr:hypothetical protein [Candidatus Parcubacteria bacterium]